MFSYRFKSVITGAATLMGTIIGVGMFGLPYVAAKTGIFTVVGYLLFFGAFVLLLHLVYGEIVLRTKEKHRLTGYAKLYLGKYGKIIAAVAFFFGIYGSLLAYLVIGGNFLSIIFSNFFSGFSPFTGSIVLLVFSLVVVGRGVESIGMLEIAMGAVIISLIVGVLIYGAHVMNFENLLFDEGGGILLPYGVVLFSLWGTAAIPEVRRFVLRSPKLMLPVVMIGTLIPIILYIIFTASTLAISGGATTQDSIEGLIPYLGINFSTYGALVGFLAVITSFVVLSATMKNSYNLDFGIPKKTSFLLVFAVPFLLFVLGARSFIEIIDWVGAVLVGIEGSLLLFLHKEAQEKGDRSPEYKLIIQNPVRYALVAILFIAVVSRFL